MVNAWQEESLVPIELIHLLLYSHGLILYEGTTDKDVEYCGCIDYHCRTLEYTDNRYRLTLFFFFLCV
jgi:hypothetical protein